MKTIIIEIVMLLMLSGFGFCKIPHNLGDFTKMNLGIHSSDSESQFISMVQAYNYTYNVNYTIRQLYKNITYSDALFQSNFSITSNVVARTTGITSEFGWYNPNDPLLSQQSLFEQHGDYFDYYSRSPSLFNPGQAPIGFYLNATEMSHPAYPGGMWYSQSHLNSDVGSFDHLLTLKAPDEWLVRQNGVVMSYLLCWEDMFWQGGVYSRRYRNGYAPNSYISSAGIYQSDRDYNDLIVQIDHNQPMTIPEPATIVFAMFGLILWSIFGLLKKAKKYFK